MKQKFRKLIRTSALYDLRVIMVEFPLSEVKLYSTTEQTANPSFLLKEFQAFLCPLLSHV